ncbi:MAG TPA: hypothetical protein VK781_12775 [Solirubrobacteraceae bacterium]|jgi:hypothetical protein|nr:hypothetical protein [Solirubrobacteraceae bacterium]
MTSLEEWLLGAFEPGAEIASRQATVDSWRPPDSIFSPSYPSPSQPPPRPTSNETVNLKAAFLGIGQHEPDSAFMVGVANDSLALASLSPIWAELATLSLVHDPTFAVTASGSWIDATCGSWTPEARASPLFGSLIRQLAARVQTLLDLQRQALVKIEAGSSSPWSLSLHRVTSQTWWPSIPEIGLYELMASPLTPGGDPPSESVPRRESVPIVDIGSADAPIWAFNDNGGLSWDYSPSGLGLLTPGYYVQPPYSLIISIGDCYR